MKEKEFPKINNLYHLSNKIGLKWEVMKLLSSNNFDAYHSFFVYQKNKKRRKIDSPDYELELCQKYILDYVLSRIPVSLHAKGFLKNESVIKNASAHKNSKKFLNIDLKNFFGTIEARRIYYIFFSLCGYDINVSNILTQICTHKNALPQGAPTSPMLSNIVAYKMDKRISRYCEQNKLIYTRYADDITISGDETMNKNRVLNMLQQIVSDEGFELNKQKTRSSTNFGVVTGIVTGQSRVGIKQSYRRMIQQELYCLERYGLANRAEIKEITPELLMEQLHGQIMWVRQVMPELASIYLERYNKIFNMN